MNLKVFAIFLLFQFMKLGQVQSDDEDYYTSISGLEYLLDSEIYLLENYENYMEKIKQTNERIIKFLEEVETNIEVIKKNPAKYFGNPLNAFKELKRCVIEWKRLENFINIDQNAIDYAKNVSQMTELNYANATKTDVIGASRGLARLQSTYALEAADIAEGILIDYEYETKLTAHDCFIIGKSLYDAQQFYYAAEWLLEARMLLNAELEAEGGESLKDKTLYDFPFLSDVDILEFLAPTMFNLGNKKMARLFNEELLAQDAENKYGLANKALFDSNVLEERRVHLFGNPTSNPIKKNTPVQELYEATCRGEVQQTPREQRNLRCRNVNQNIPYHFLAPFKMEELNHDPFVALYHDAIYDNEMEKIMNVTVEYIERSKVGDADHSTFSEIRTSKNTWLYYHEHDFLSTVRQRLIDITGLSIDSAEPLQVANYGIGGHYGPHYDFSETPDETYPGAGNRLLTALFYINDVELGGATAFPFLKLAVPAIRGGLVVWYNMHESLELDFRTRHAGCPVLKGSKWICNEWFHQVGQEFLRPCSLDRMGEISLKYKFMV